MQKTHGTRKRFSLLFPRLIAAILIIVFSFYRAGRLQASENDSIKITDPRCEYVRSLQGLDHQSPNFGWILISGQRGQKQTAYQIVVNNSKGHPMWDSGKVFSSESSHVRYAGKPLQSSSDYFWKVRIWDKDGQPGPYTPPAHFATALLDGNEWKAQWIGRGPAQEPVVRWGTNFQEKDLEQLTDFKPDYQSALLRKEVFLGKPVQTAKVHICGLGLYELHVNGSKIGKTREHVPLKTDYSKQVLYNSYDISGQMSKGVNAIGVMLGNGWFNSQKKYWDWRMQWWGSKKMIVQIHLTYQDGSEEKILSDHSWKTSAGPVVSSCIYDGEVYDAAREQPGWDQPGFDDHDWQMATLVQPPGGKLVSQTAPPITVTETLHPKSVKEVQPGVFVFDMGQNFAGWTRITCRGPRGTKIQLRHAENIHADGTLDRKTIGFAENIDTYLLKGDGRVEVYEPHFTNHGYQYVEVTGYPGVPALKDVQGRVAHSDCKTIGQFECSNDLVNHLYHSTFWTHRSLLQGVPVDCPQRGERLGWGADALLMAEGTLLNFDSYQFYAKWFRDVQLQQDQETGNLPYISPWNGGGGGYPAWSSAYVVMNWYCYQYYGNKHLLAKHYDPMRRYVDYLQGESSGHIQPRDGSGDWKSLVGGTVRGGPLLISTAFYYYCTHIVAESAKVLGKSEDAEKYGRMAGEIARAFNNVFQSNQRTGYKYGENTQCENAAPLFLGIVPANKQKAVIKNLLDDIRAHDTHLTTGFHGAKWVMEALPRYGRTDIAYELLTQKTYPSWGDMTKGRNTVSETWEATGTNNHGGLGGTPNPWIFKILAGINVDAQNPGFERILIKPYIPGDMSYAKASVYTIKGLVESHWKKDNGRILLNVSIPANTTALIYLPTSDSSGVKEGSIDAERAPGVHLQGKESEAILYTIDSGQYEFVFPAERP